MKWIQDPTVTTGLSDAAHLDVLDQIKLLTPGPAGFHPLVVWKVDDRAAAVHRLFKLLQPHQEQKGAARQESTLKLLDRIYFKRLFL